MQVLLRVSLKARWDATLVVIMYVYLSIDIINRESLPVE